MSLSAVITFEYKIKFIDGCDGDPPAKVITHNLRRKH